MARFVLCTTVLLSLCVCIGLGAYPNHWTSFYRAEQGRAHQQQQEAGVVCEMRSEPVIACKTAVLVLSEDDGTVNHTYVHVCPVDKSELP